MFIINSGSGNNNTDYEAEIKQYFSKYPGVTIINLVIDPDTDLHTLKEQVLNAQPDRVIAVGGDGTIKLVAEMLLHTAIPMGIVPAGSANGMAKELNISMDTEKALELVRNGTPQRIHLVKVNDELCIHLSDIGFNAYVVKTFDSFQRRGMMGYIKAAWRALWHHYKMKAVFYINGQVVKREAVMIVVANATSYGTGITINPEGKLDDDLFEVVVVKKISIVEIFKMGFTQLPFNPRKTELFQTNALTITSRKKVHFQVDGEYLGKVNEVKAELLPQAISIIY